jgi:surface polysaccharide O-acyltransferase-like enzyme
MQQIFSPNKLNYIHTMRLLAIIAVVAQHISEPFMIFGNMESFSWWHYCALNAFCRWDVPIFVMISGALLLEQAGRNESVKIFFKKRLRRVGIPLLAQL